MSRDFFTVLENACKTATWRGVADFKRVTTNVKLIVKNLLNVYYLECCRLPTNKINLGLFTLVFHRPFIKMDQKAAFVKKHKLPK